MGVGEEQVGLLFELSFHFVNHFHSSFTDRLGGGGGERKKKRKGRTGMREE